jgi:hypothetical protein
MATTQESKRLKRNTRTIRRYLVGAEQGKGEKKKAPPPYLNYSSALSEYSTGSYVSL